MRHWREFLILAGNDNAEAAVEAEWLLEWVASEMLTRQLNMEMAVPQQGPVEVNVEDVVEARTVGDVRKALAEGKKLAVKVSSISLGPPFGPNIAQPKFSLPADQSKWDALERVLTLCDAEGGNRAEAMLKLIARVALAKGVDRRQIINISLADFVVAARNGKECSEQLDAAANADQPEPVRPILAVDQQTTKLQKKHKRSTVSGEGRSKLIAALTMHHKYSKGSCLNWNPVGNNALAELAGVSGSTASAFFKLQYGNHSKYKTCCQNESNLVTSLKMLNDELTPSILFNRLPDEHADAESDDDGDE